MDNIFKVRLYSVAVTMTDNQGLISLRMLETSRGQVRTLAWPLLLQWLYWQESVLLICIVEITSESLLLYWVHYVNLFLCLCMCVCAHVHVCTYSTPHKNLMLQILLSHLRNKSSYIGNSKPLFIRNFPNSKACKISTIRNDKNVSPLMPTLKSY